MNLELYSTSSVTVLKPVTLMISRHVQAAEIGIMIEFVIKSKKSRILKPSGVMKSKTPNPSEMCIRDRSSITLGRDIAPDFKGVIDTVSISLNAPTKEE